MSLARRVFDLTLVAFLAATPLRALEIKFDYSYDSLGFFSEPSRKTTLEAAARSWEQQLAGAQTPAIPLGTGGNTWTLSFNRPDQSANFGGANTNIVNKPLPANTVIIYVGARPDVYGGYLGYAEYNYSAFGSSSWVQLIQDRNTGTRFASFGGAIAFDSDAHWYFDPDPVTKEDHPGKMDFYTLAMHEIGHLLGFTYGAAAFSRQALGGKFSGPRVVALYGQAPHLGIGGHWQDDFQFQGNPVVMAPHLTSNERAWLNPLDVAVLHDLGYKAETGLRVTLNPSAAASAGAQWRLDEGTWKKDGETILGLTAGKYTLMFKSPSTYLPPQSQTITLVEGVVAEVSVDFVPVPSPAIEVPPKPLLVQAGTSVHLEVVAGVDGAPLQYRWSKGGKVLSKATGPRLDFSDIKTSDAGAYAVRVFTAGGTTPELTAQVGVVGVVSGPETIKEGGTLKLKQFASGPALSYQWCRNDQPLQDDPALGISGSATSQLQIKSVTAHHDGAYHCVVSMGDGSGGSLEQGGAVKNVTVQLRPVLDDQLPGPWRVSGEVNDQFTAQNHPTRFQVSGLPRGVRLDSFTGRLSGRPLAPGLFRLKVTASNAAGTSAPKEFIVPCAGLEPLWQGRFSGLIERGQLNEELGGLIALTVQASGAMSGRFTLGKKRHPLRGVIDALPGPDATALLQVNRGRGLAPLHLDLRFDGADGQLTGTIRKETSPGLGLKAWQSAWHVGRHPASVYAGDLAAALLPALQTSTDEKDASMTSHSKGGLLPEGAGYATAKVSPSGMVTWTGRLADGSAHTQSVVLSAQGHLPLHALLYQGAGSAQGWAMLSARSETSPESELHGLLDWCKQQAANARDRTHADGFPACEVIVIGGSRRPREPAVVQLDLPIDLENNAALSFSGAGLDAAELGLDTAIDLTISASNRVTLPPPDVNPASTRITSLNTATNVFTGSFTLRDEDPDTGDLVVRKVGFQGLMVPRLRQGLGWFLLPQLTPKNPLLQRSGFVLLEGLSFPSQ